MDILTKIAEQKIREAIERGEFDNLAYHGKPLKLEDLSGVPDALRMGYKILKNAGVLPPELQLRKDILALQDLLNACYDEDERRLMQQQLNEKTLRYHMMLERQFHKPASKQYRAEILRKLKLAP
jgi:DnaJ homologue, subfamily C, member 28, conserved domain